MREIYTETAPLAPLLKVHHNERLERQKFITGH